MTMFLIPTGLLETFYSSCFEQMCKRSSNLHFIPCVSFLKIEFFKIKFNYLSILKGHGGSLGGIFSFPLLYLCIPSLIRSMSVCYFYPQNCVLLSPYSVSVMIHRSSSLETDYFIFFTALPVS